MKNLEWVPVYYNGIETNIEVTKCGKVKRVRTDWETRKTKIGEIYFYKLKLNNGYKSLKIKIKKQKSKTVFVHQLVAQAFLKYDFGMSKIFEIHHKKEPKTNNNLDNLQVITHRENMSKERTAKSGLHVGVCFNKNAKKYQSKITINNNTIHLGYFNTIEEASYAYQQKLKTI
jgi:hypothetical protein